jgi:phosphohistidine swiveling domain-containing protein
MEIQNLAKQYIYWPEIDNKYQQNFDFSKVKVKDMIPLLQENLRDSHLHVSDHIIKFYSLNEALSKIRQEENDILDEKALQLYDEYKKEVELLSVKLFSYIFMISAMEARYCYSFNSVSKEIQNYSDDQLDLFGHTETHAQTQKRIEKQTASFFKKEINEFEVPASKKASFSKIFKIVYDLSEASAGRNGLSRNFIKAFSQPEYENLTLGEAFYGLSRIFKMGAFEGGFGGEPWYDIAHHGENFANGEISAEVFVDQAFSLEHNSGQIFNKEIIFHDPEYMDVNESTVGIPLFCLSLQHEGQLLSFLTKNYKDKTLDKYLTEPMAEKFSKMHLLPYDNEEEGTEYDIDDKMSSLEDIVQFTKTEFESFASVIKKFNQRNPGFIKHLKSLDVTTPQFDYVKILDAIASKNEDFYFEEYNFDDFHFPLFNHLVEISNGAKPAKKQVIKKGKKSFFDCVDTSHVPENKMDKHILGNKAYGLAQMQKMGLPVPKAWVFPATNSSGFFKDSEKWNNKLHKFIPHLIKEFIDEQGNPMLCSVRSGSAISMPGMMDTILNVGIDDSNYNYFCQKMGKDTVDECAIKFMSLVSKSIGENITFSSNLKKSLKAFSKVLDKHHIAYDSNATFPLVAQQQFELCIQSVFKSWHSERATAYRNHHNVSHDIGTAAIVQQMVFGNLNEYSCTGVAFSRDCINGKKGIIGEFLVKAQGEDVVSGSVTPTNIKEMPAFSQKAYKELVNICKTLEEQNSEIQDIEFTVEDNKLYILQKRKAVCSNVAQNALNQELHKQGKISSDELLASIKVEDILSVAQINAGKTIANGSGLIANPGVLRGIVVNHESDLETYEFLYNKHKHEKNFGWIFYAPETSPEYAPIMIKTDAFITSNGGFTSHAAILARSWKKPCVVGAGELPDALTKAGNLVTLDATHGKIYEGMLPLQENNNGNTKKLVNLLLSHYNINLELLQKDNPFSQLTEQVNQHDTWMEKFDSCKNVKRKAQKTIKHEKFLALGQKVALMLLKDQEKQYKVKI